MDFKMWFSAILLLNILCKHQTNAEEWHNLQMMSYFADASQQYTRPEAEEACLNRGGRLAVLKNAEIHQFAYSILPVQNLLGGAAAYHIALTRGSISCDCRHTSESECAACRLSWRWDDGSPMIYNGWRLYWPIASNGDCGCENSLKEFGNVRCYERKGYICQYSCSLIGCKRRDCSFSSTGVYSCQCDPGYTGQHCDTVLDISKCDRNPCDNGGTCVDHISNFTCECSTGYTGTNCETDIDECFSNPCQHDGICLELTGRYICICGDHYHGMNCEVRSTVKKILKVLSLAWLWLLVFS